MPLFQVVRRTHAESEDDLSVYFVERYRDLRQWAMQITSGDAAAAEDLVQEAYVSMAQSPRAIDFTGNMDGYFYRVLRNLHLSDMRRSWKQRHQDLSVLDFDSLYLQLHCARSFDTVELQNQLTRLCGYLCERKEKSSAVCVFLLRFFRGYLPEEIMAIARIPRAAVDKKMRIARTSARQYLKKRPESLEIRRRFFPDPEQPRYVLESDAFLQSIRNDLRRSDKGTCLTAKEIDAFYGADKTSRPGTHHLAHLVSCEPCLVRISSVLSVPPPSARSPFDQPEPTREDAETRLRRAQQLLRETLAHQPSTLTLAVNGEVVLSFDVASANLRQSVTLPASTNIEFVEVFGDAGLRLLMIHVEQAPPFGPPEILEVLRLNSQRTLTVSIAWLGLEPKVHVSYELPPSDAAHRQRSSMSDLLDSEILSISERPSLQAPRGSLWERFLRWLFSHRLFLLPVAVATLLLCASIAVWQRHRLEEHRVPDASALLSRSIQAETAVAASGDLVHRAIAVQELSETGAVITTQRVEEWRQGSQVSRRLYDAQGRVIAHEWQAAAGQGQVQREGRIEAAPSDAVSCEAIESSWMCDLSAESYERRLGRATNRQVRETESDYVISSSERTDRLSTSDAEPILHAVLVLDRRQLHAKRQETWIHDGGQVRHLRYTEVSYDRQSHIDPSSSIFGPDTPPASRLRRNAAPVLNNQAQAAELVHLQLQILKRLHSISADVGEPIDIKVVPEKAVAITGVLSDQRAREVRAALADISHDPSIRINIHSASEARRLRIRPRGPAIGIDQFEIDATRSPSDRILRAHFGRLGYAGAELDDQIYRYTQSVLAQSAKTLQQAWALHRLGVLATQEGAHDLSSADRQDFLFLLQEQTSQLASDLTALDAAVSWLPDLLPGDDPTNSLHNTAATLPAVIEDALSNVTRINNALHARLEVSGAPSSTDSPDPPISPIELRQSLLMANDAVFRIEHATQQYLAHVARF